LKRAFLTVAGRQLHYRWGGNGAPIVMLHPSPLSSAALLPLAAELAKGFRVYALDTPGYGQSESLPFPPQSLDDYLPTFAAALDALGLGRVCLYGAATGAQFAIEFSRRYPERVALMVIDSAGHIDADECERIVRDYFPDVSPRQDGSHLATLWQMVRDLFVFFPWCDRRAATRIDRDLPPPAVMQGMLHDYLRAGSDYSRAYRPAFYNERAERAQQVRVPAVLTRWQGSIVLRITDALIAAGLPANYHVLDLGPSAAERFEGIRAYLQRHYRAAAAPAVPASALPNGRLGSVLLDIDGMQLHARCATGQGRARPSLRLHSSASSAAFVEMISVRGSVSTEASDLILLDLPGNGESGAPPDPAGLSIEKRARYALAALNALGIDQVDVAGRYGGGSVALEMARQAPERIASVTLVGRSAYSEAERTALLATYTPSFTPELDGTHLLRAWYWVRDQSLWSPHTRKLRANIIAGAPQLDLEHMQQKLVDVIGMGERYALAYAAEFNYPLDAVQRTLGCPVQSVDHWQAVR